MKIIYKKYFLKNVYFINQVQLKTAINLNRLCSKFEDDISKNELSVTVCLGVVTYFPHWVAAKPHWSSQ